MNIDKLGVLPFNTTLMGVIQGALDFYGLEYSVPTVFGASGHAFLINIHKELCPSGPYCWERSKMDPLIANLGLRMNDLGFYSPQSSQAGRNAVEEKLRSALNEGIPCSLLNLENQLITGYDVAGIFTTQPWAPKVDFPPSRLSFGTWKELGDQFHISFYTITKVKPSDRLHTILDSLAYALDLHRNPAAHSWPDYAIGPQAYMNWIRAAAESGSTHGNWWNGTVWSECRAMAARYIAEIGKEYSRVSCLTASLEQAYIEIAAALCSLSDRQMDSQKKTELLMATKDKEAKAIGLVANLEAALKTI